MRPKHRIAFWKVAALIVASAFGWGSTWTISTWWANGLMVVSIVCFFFGIICFIGVCQEAAKDDANKKDD